MVIRSRRTRAELVPVHTDQAAATALARIRVARRLARDPELGFLPDQVTDPDDLEIILRYLEGHPPATVEHRRAELPHRALLVQYQHQQAVTRYEKRVLGVLDTGHAVKGRPRDYGTPLGLPTSQLCWNRRRDLSVVYHEYGQPRQTTREAARAHAIDTWLTTRRTDLVAVVEMLVDHRDTLIDTVPDGDRADLADAIDTAGAGLAARPAPAVAAAVSYAAYLLRHAAPADFEVRDGLATAARLRTEYQAVTSKDGNSCR